VPCLREFAKNLRDLVRPPQAPSLHFFSDQLLRTPLAFDLLNLVNERSLTNAMLGSHDIYRSRSSAKEVQRDRLVPPKARMARSNQLMRGRLTKGEIKYDKDELQKCCPTAFALLERLRGRKRRAPIRAETFKIMKNCERKKR
jgi:hypothetical protein